MSLGLGDWRRSVLWGCGLASALALLTWVMRDAAAEQLQRDTLHSAANWAELAGSTVPDLEALFDGRGPTAAASEQLKRLQHASQVFRFKLFDPQGRQVLVSDGLGGLQQGGNAGLGAHTVDGHAPPPSALVGMSYIRLKREKRPGWPAVYSEAYVPLVRDGRELGIVEVYVDQVERAASADRAFARVAGTVAALLTLLVAIIAFQMRLSQRKQRDVDAQMRYLAHHDVLTGALNRASFHDALNHAGRRHTDGGLGFALLCIDLDHFKDVNDSLGHAAGDEVLRQAVRRLHVAARHCDYVARLGGDEFAVLQSGVSNLDDVSTLAERILVALAAPYEVGGVRVHCGGSIGAAVQAAEAADQDELLHKADLALYRAKASGRNTVRFYDATIDQVRVVQQCSIDVTGSSREMRDRHYVV